MSTVNPLRADQYEEVDGGPGEGRTVGFKNGSDDEAPQPLSPQYINNKRGNGVENNTRAIHDTSKSAQSSADQGKALKIVIYGAVNAMMAIPILYGYAAIIFRYASRTLDIYVFVRVAELQHSTKPAAAAVICLCSWCGYDLRCLCGT